MTPTQRAEWIQRHEQDQEEGTNQMRIVCGGEVPPPLPTITFERIAEHAFGEGLGVVAVANLTKTIDGLVRGFVQQALKKV